MVSTTFRELGLSAPILRQLEKPEHKPPTPIQAACIPLLLQNKNLMELAQTGTSGKAIALCSPGEIKKARNMHRLCWDASFPCTLPAPPFRLNYGRPPACAGKEKIPCGRTAPHPAGCRGEATEEAAAAQTDF